MMGAYVDLWSAKAFSVLELTSASFLTLTVSRCLSPPKSIWPLYLIINEMPYNKRFTRKNMLFAGMWLEEKKPAMWTF